MSDKQGASGRGTDGGWGRRMVLATGLAALLVAGGSFLYLHYSREIKTGEQSIEVMTDAQRQTARQLAQLPAAATLEDIKAVLGEPVEAVDGRLKWRCPHKPDHARILANATSGRVVKIRYLSIDPTWGWEINSVDGKWVLPGDRLP